MKHLLKVEPLTREAFKPYGDVIEASAGAQCFTINAGFAQRFHDLATVDVARGGGYPIISIFRTQARQFPLHIELLERHPLGSQAFVAMSPVPFLVVVAMAAALPDPGQMRCFYAAPGQGVNYAPGTWHHPLIALRAGCDFLVVDRGGGGAQTNCDEHPLTDISVWIADVPS